MTKWVSKRPKKKAEEFDTTEITAIPIPMKDKKFPKHIRIAERKKSEADLLHLEWVFKYPTLSPTAYLGTIKGYSKYEVNDLLARLPPPEWYARKEKIGDEITADLIKRHTHVIAEVQEQHIRASNVGLAKAIEMIAKMSIDPLMDDDGKIKVDPKTGKPLYKGFRSIDLLNCLSSIKIAQEIYRKAMGLPNDGEGLAQILDKLVPVQNSTQINISVESEKDKKMNELSYDDLMLLIEHKREALKKEEEKENDPTPRV